MTTLDLAWIIVVIITASVLAPIMCLLIPDNKNCKYCGEKAVVKGETYRGQTIYMCSNCLRAYRFREKEIFKSIKLYGKET